MLCERCQKKQANVQLKQNLNGTVREHHLCSECARESGIYSFSILSDYNTPGNFFGETFFNDPFGSFTARAMASPPATQTCETCGQTLNDFKQSGRFGCPDCYTTFREPIRALLNQVHGSDRHVPEQTESTEIQRANEQDSANQTGAVKSNARTATHQTRIQALKTELQAAVAVENYERAARLRDEIKKLEQQEVAE